MAMVLIERLRATSGMTPNPFMEYGLMMKQIDLLISVPVCFSSSVSRATPSRIFPKQPFTPRTASWISSGPSTEIVR